jgi:hypothetical protein
MRRRVESHAPAGRREGRGDERRDAPLPIRPADVDAWEQILRIAERREQRARRPQAELDDRGPGKEKIEGLVVRQRHIRVTGGSRGGAANCFTAEDTEDAEKSKKRHIVRVSCPRIPILTAETTLHDCESPAPKLRRPTRMVRGGASKDRTGRTAQLSSSSSTGGRWPCMWRRSRAVVSRSDPRGTTSSI